MYRKRLLILVGMSLVLVGCLGGDDGGESARITMENVWPHADGSTWTYDYKIRMYDTTEDGPATALPSMETLYQDLQQPVAGVLIGDSSLVYTVSLDGEVTTDAGVTAQHMIETVEPVAQDANKGPRPAAPTHERRLLRLVAAARPELRAAVAARLGEDPFAKGFEPIMVLPMFLGGYAFAYEDSGYYGYGDLYRDHSWLYLEGDLRPGEEFSLQLARGLAEDIWLHGRIWSVHTRMLGGQRYANLLECMYVIDLGEQEMADENGEPAGTMYSYIYGIVWYAPEVGPVGCRERSRVMIRTAYQPEGTGQILTWESVCRIEDAVLPRPE